LRDFKRRTSHYPDATSTWGTSTPSLGLGFRPGGGVDPRDLIKAERVEGSIKADAARLGAAGLKLCWVPLLGSWKGCYIRPPVVEELR